MRHANAKPQRKRPYAANGPSNKPKMRHANAKPQRRPGAVNKPNKRVNARL